MDESSSSEKSGSFLVALPFFLRHTPPSLPPGVDLVLHSMTKYLGGHSDLLGGVVVSGKDEGDENAITAVHSFASGDIIRKVGGWASTKMKAWR